MLNKLTTIYICKDKRILDITTKQLMTKYQDVTVYDKGVLVRKRGNHSSDIELVKMSELDDILIKEEGIVILKDIPYEKVSDYTGVVKSILILKDNTTSMISDLRTLSHKKMVEVDYL